jgi:hypothetical protein
VAQWETTSGTSNRWKRLKRKQNDVPVYARIAIPLLLVLLCGRLAWDGVRAILYQTRHASAEQAPTATEKSPPQLVATSSPWQTDVADSLAASEREAGAGRLMTAEVDVDRADSIISVAQLQGRSAEPEFFAASIATLDRVEQRAKDDGMVPHVTQARIELAGLRSSLETPADADDADEKQVQIAAPRPLAAGTTLDPASLGGNYIDATLMADEAEILLPPSSRSLADNVRVENLTLAGAAQTLDGIHWKNVTFVSTRLRYEGGPIDLQDVHFVRCSFGLTTDARGAKIANAVALGQTTLVIP